MKDPYQVLSVSPTASPAEIKAAYRSLAKELHPDVNPGDTIVEHRFKEVTAAYDLLSDSEKKGQYDRREINADGSPRYDQSFHRGGGGGGFGGGNFEDAFSDLFGRRRTRQVKGKDVTYSVRILFLEAVEGVRRRVQLYDGKKLDVDIPAGSQEGDTLRLKNQGMDGFNGGPAGDAFVEIHVDAHPFFERDGMDIHLEVPITLSEAVLGAKINVPTPHGPVVVNVPPGTNTGRTLRLKGRGMVKGTGTAERKGDQYIRLKVTLPDKPDAKLEEFAREWL
ncbi:MAG: J domain-containing protein, partial [Alphaproteobacteria bacterium]|nr:J domain-containing protein [Alphaproteobacteria bacterium]